MININLLFISLLLQIFLNIKNFDWNQETIYFYWLNTLRWKIEVLIKDYPLCFFDINNTNNHQKKRRMVIKMESIILILENNWNF